jgi:hypothetical protein
MKASEIIENLLEESSRLTEVGCPYCGQAEYPVAGDKSGYENVSAEDAEEWHLDHSDDCAITYLEKAHEQLVKEQDFDAAEMSKEKCKRCGGTGWIYDPMKVQREMCDKSCWGQLSCRPCPDCSVQRGADSGKGFRLPCPDPEGCKWFIEAKDLTAQLATLRKEIERLKHKVSVAQEARELALGHNAAQLAAAKKEIEGLKCERSNRDGFKGAWLEVYELCIELGLVFSDAESGIGGVCRFIRGHAEQLTVAQEQLAAAKKEKQRFSEAYNAKSEEVHRYLSGAYVKHIEVQLAAAKKEIDLRFRYGEFLYSCCLSGEEPKTYEWFCEIEKAAEKLHQQVFEDEKGGER